MKKILIGLGLLLSCGTAHAGLISYHGYTLDEDKNIVTGGGVEWLQWDLTIAKSINSTIADIADGTMNGIYYGTGWRLASNAEMAALFNAFVFGANFTWDSLETTSQTATTPFDVAEDISTDPELQFISLFGRTDPLSASANTSNPRRFSGALFGLDLNGDFNYNFVTVYDDYIQAVSGTQIANFARIGDDQDFDGDSIVTNRGIALVRDIPVVPEPRALALFAFALLVLLTKMRMRNNK